jgi:outer membrane putative beta-barrel porin/alpha-amylase
VSDDFFAITKRGRCEWTVCVLTCVSILTFDGAARAADPVAARNPPPAHWDWSGWFSFDPFKATGGLLDGFQHQTNKDQYTLFNPTPPALMREFKTDRPDNTESPFTVDAGHFQTETTLFGYTRFGPSSDRSGSDSYDFGTTNVRIGLTNWGEISLIWQPYGVVQTHAPSRGGSTQQSGVGGLEIRTKINLWGDDTFDKPGATAFGLLPFVTLPTDRGNGISPDWLEGGLILPYEIKLTEKFDVGLNAGVAAIHDDSGAGYHPQYIVSASLDYDWTEQLSTYYGVSAELARDSRLDVVFLATGLTYKVSKNFQLDSGVNIGVTPAADRFNPFVGASFRF